jgi:hypothetical protein
MADLFAVLFSPYGQVKKYPRTDQLAGFEWTLECDLDASFEFLLEKAPLAEISRLPMNQFKAFLGGFFDAEGTIYLHRKSSIFAPEAQIRNTDVGLLRLIARKLARMGISSKLARQEQKPSRLPRHTKGTIWSLAIWRFGSIKLLLESLNLKHDEKAQKSELALRFQAPMSTPKNGFVAAQWAKLAGLIEHERLAFIGRAKEMMESKDSASGDNRNVVGRTI